MRFLAAALLLLVPQTLDAAGKKKAPAAPLPGGPVGKAPSACGAKVLPLVAGNSWTYESVVAPNAPPPEIVKISPPQPKSFVITVKSVDTKGPDTVVTLEEKVAYDLNRDPAKKAQLDEHLVTSTITCNAKGKFEISPESFFFAAEPGGYYGMTFDKLDRSKDTSWKLVNGVFGDAEWREDLVAHWTRTPSTGVDAKLGSGKLELERKFIPLQPETVQVKLGTYPAEKLGLTTTGRITLDGASASAKPSELPANWINQLWIVAGVGVVQTLNTYGHQYQLTDAQLK